MNATTIVIHPVRTALFFGLVPPFAGVVMAVAGYFPAVSSVGAYGGQALTFIAIAGYLMGAPPLAATGAIVGFLARRGRSAGDVLALSAVIGLWCGAVSAIAWQWSGWLSTGSKGLIALTLASGAASFAAAVVLVAWARFRLRRAGGVPQAG